MVNKNSKNHFPTTEMVFLTKRFLGNKKNVYKKSGITLPFFYHISKDMQNLFR